MTYTERAKNEVNHTVMTACETAVTVRNPALERGFCHLTAARRFFYALLPPFGKTPITPNRPAAAHNTICSVSLSWEPYQI